MGSLLQMISSQMGKKSGSGLNETLALPKNNVNWLQTAKTSPEIDLWFNSLKAAHPDLKNVSLEDFLRSGVDEFAGGIGSGYDYKSAIERGHRPQMVDDYTYHWIGQDPQTGYFFKGEEHPTRWMSEQDQQQGVQQ